ncbi:MAG: nucleotide exchange factor GrpE [Candidatus Saccharibacteria bacterium]|nr:nucleotide exchange factor GrpE [Candidatus Saccharibacteria bacterium]
MKKEQKVIEEIQKLEQENGELLLDLQRTRADFENYRKNVEVDRERAKSLAKKGLLLELLPVLDDLDLAIAHAPADLADNKWAQGVLNLNKKLATSFAKIGLARIKINANEEFNPELHEAVTFEDGDGDTEVIAEELRPGYKYQGEVLRSSMVKVKKQ